MEFRIPKGCLKIPNSTGICAICSFLPFADEDKCWYVGKKYAGHTLFIARGGEHLYQKGKEN